MITKHSASLTLVIHPQGHLDALKTDHYRSQILPLLDGGYRFLIVDLEDVPFINSSGLGLLIELYNRAQRMEGSMRLINCQPPITLLLQQTKLDKILLQEVPPSDQPVPQYDPLHNLMNEEILLLTRVNEISCQVIRLDDAPSINNAILVGVVEALRAPRGGIFLLNATNRRLALGSWHGPEGEAVPSTMPLPLDDEPLARQIMNSTAAGWYQVNGTTATAPVAGLTGMAATAGLTGMTGVTGAGASAALGVAAAVKSPFARLGFHSVLAAPINGNRSCLGLLVVEINPATSSLASVARPVIQTLANLCGMALEKVNLFQKLRNK